MYCQWEQKPSRMLMMKLTDGLHTVQGMEYRPIACLSPQVPPGSKVVILERMSAWGKGKICKQFTLFQYFFLNPLHSMICSTAQVIFPFFTHHFMHYILCLINKVHRSHLCLVRWSLSKSLCGELLPQFLTESSRTLYACSVSGVEISDISFIEWMSEFYWSKKLQLI